MGKSAIRVARAAAERFVINRKAGAVIIIDDEVADQRGRLRVKEEQDALLFHSHILRCRLIQSQPILGAASTGSDAHTHAQTLAAGLGQHLFDALRCIDADVNRNHAVSPLSKS